MELEVSGSEAIKVDDKLFGAPFNETLVHQLIVSYLACARQGSSAQKTRSDVRGGGRKPWRQKGSGRARAGTIRSPIWRGGGVTFAARPRSYKQKINRKMYKCAIRSILSHRLRHGHIIVVDQFEVEEPKTKCMIKKLEQFNLGKKVLIINEEVTSNLYLSSRNIPNVDVCHVSSVNPVKLVSCDNLIASVVAIRRLEEVLV